MAEVRIEVEIAATPEEVRAVVLDFASYPQWHSSFIKSLTPIPEHNPPLNLAKGDKIRAAFHGSTVDVAVIANMPSDFRWRGSSFFGAFAGEHFFQFLDSKITDGGCTMVHGEHYDGWLSIIVREGKLGFARNAILALYGGYSNDLKQRVENLKAANKV
ncbi:hypothetical protein IQ07DRAFT_260686 [Pyrenochaeta sp. DS3sAY3a]|nr:hypothetical protein IQ07DRAFT_260686 [Pyrenochaeta sp. DS3sAY3a]